MSRGRAARTEDVARAVVSREAPIRRLKTSPAAFPMIRDPSVDSVAESFQCENWSVFSYPALLAVGSHLEVPPMALEDPESDLSSASGRSASASSVSTPSSREIDLMPEAVAETSITPEHHRNTTFASQMHMSQFRREQGLLEWGIFVRRLRERLPEKPTGQNESFQLIDYGGSGSVYATAFKTNRRCDTLAIKVLRNKKPESAMDLPNEFRIMRDLQHNHVVAFIDAFNRKGQFAVLMYPVAICNLAEYLKEESENNHFSRQNLDKRTTLLTAIGCLSSTVMYLHGPRKIKHKDIKPENILFNVHGSVLLADFGVSKRYEDNTLTEGTTPFTDKYAPPEVVDQDKRGLSTDIFSLGCVFLEMVTVILGETLEDLNQVVFESSDGQRYRDFPTRVAAWVNQLKRVAYLASCPFSSAEPHNHDGNGRPSKQSLSEHHLSTILLMMSTSPHERPPTKTVYEIFKGFADQCQECQASRNAPLENSHRYASNPKTIVQHAALTDARSNTDCQQHKIQLATMYGSPNIGCRGSTRLPQTPPSSIDGMGNDNASETESNSADEYHCAPSLRAKINRMLDSQKGQILLYLRTGSFTSCAPDGSSGNRRQGSPISGPPSKRRSVENRRVQPLPDGEGNEESDGEEDSGERRGGNSEPGAESSAMTKMFACPFYQRDRTRCPNRSCKGPGWTSFPRVKEHLERVHRIYRCPRCQETFNQINGLSTHQRQRDACEVRDRELHEIRDWSAGFDEEQHIEIKSRLRGLSLESKWKRCYKILFPNDRHIPSAYCTDETAQRISNLTDRLSHDINERHPQVPLSDLVQLIRERLATYARQDQTAREQMYDVLSSRESSIMQRGASDQASMSSESSQFDIKRSSSPEETTPKDRHRMMTPLTFSPESLQQFARSNHDAHHESMRHSDFAHESAILQQPTPDHTRMDLEPSSLDFPAGMEGIGFANPFSAKVFHDSNQANTTSDSACFPGSTLTQNPELDFESFMEPLSDGFQLDTDFGFQDNVPLADFPPYGTGQIAPCGQGHNHGR